ncbi:MAG: DUF3267 domain-containing protein [Candidatus Hodarchaeota archaeon]
MDNQDFHIVADYHQNELTPIVLIGTLFLGILGVLLTIPLIILKQSLNISFLFPETYLTFWSFFFIIIFFIIGMIIVHELIHAFTAWTFNIPTKFGWGMLGKFIPYFSVSLGKSVDRYQYIWIGVMPNIIINVFLVFLILFTEAQLLYSFFVILLITHISGGGGDAALLYTAFKYPSTILLKDTGLQLQILSQEDLEKKPLIDQDSPIMRVFHKNREILNFLGFNLVIFFLLIVLAPLFETILTFILGKTPNFFLNVVETSEQEFTISLNYVNCFLSSIILALIIWLVKKK